MPLPACPVPLSLDPHWQQLLHIGAGGSQLLVSNLHVTLEPFPCACFCCHREMCPAVVAKCHCSLWVRGTLMAYLNQIYSPHPRARTEGGMKAQVLCRAQPWPLQTAVFMSQIISKEPREAEQSILQGSLSSSALHNGRDGL